MSLRRPWTPLQKYLGINMRSRQRLRKATTILGGSTIQDLIWCSFTRDIYYCILTNFFFRGGRISIFSHQLTLPASLVGALFLPANRFWERSSDCHAEHSFGFGQSNPSASQARSGPHTHITQLERLGVLTGFLCRNKRC